MSKTNRIIAIFEMSDPDGLIDGYRKYYLQELRKVTDYIFVIIRGSLSSESRDDFPSLVDSFLVRQDDGFTSKSWIEAIKYIGYEKLLEYDALLLLDDKFFGPLYPLKDLLDAAGESDADFYGASKTYSVQEKPDPDGIRFNNSYIPNSISCFYIIKKRLLHSPEFISYWTRDMTFRNENESIAFAGTDFYRYVKNAGFRIDTLQDDQFKGYSFDDMLVNMKEMIAKEKIPFASIKAMSDDLFFENLYSGYGNDACHTLEYIKNNTGYDENLIWDHLLRTKSMETLWQQLQLEYIVGDEYLEKPFTYSKPIAVILHIYYADLVETMADYCVNFPPRTQFFVTTTTDETFTRIEEEFSKRELHYVLQKRPNAGFAMTSLWITYSDVVLSGEYEYIFYFHDKKSPYFEYEIQGEQFAKRCYENLCGSKYVVNNIINLFEENQRLGVLAPSIPYHSNYAFCEIKTWSFNIKQAQELINKLELNVKIDINNPPIVAYGDMIWFRASALKKAIGHGFTIEEFNVCGKTDCTILHAIERSYGYMAQDAGFYCATVITSDNARSDCNNFRNMLETGYRKIVQKGFRYDNFQNILAFFNYYKYSSVKKPDLGSLSTKKVIRHKLRARLPQKIYKPLVIVKRLLFGPHNIPFSYDD